MLLQLDFESRTPIYRQIRDQVVLGIARGALRDGERLTELLKQPQEELLPLSRQVCLLLAAEHGVFSETPVAEVLHRRTALLSVLAAEEGSTLRAIDSSGTLTQAQQDSLVACMERFKARKDGEGDAADA